MRFLEKLNRKYKVIATDSVTKDIEHLAGDVISLGYDEKTEKELLSILEKLHSMTKSGVTADTNWDQIIKQNRAKKTKQKADMLARNKKVIEDAKKGKSTITKRTADDVSVDNETPSKENEQVKKKVAEKIKSLDNVISIDSARKAKSQPSPKQDEESDEEFAQRLERVRSSLNTINTLMREFKKLKSQQGD